LFVFTGWGKTSQHKACPKVTIRAPDKLLFGIQGLIRNLCQLKGLTK